MIIIRNRQRTVAVDVQHLQRDAERLLELLGYTGFDLTILITNDATMRRYNRTYRAVDAPTDILSFPFYTELKAGDRINARDEEERILGDLLISAPYVVRAAQQAGIPFAARMRILLVHGVCHLLGYDHIADEEYVRMHAQESLLLAHLASAPV